MPETLGTERVGGADPARKRAAVELIAREGGELRRTARRYSLCEEDAEDAYQRALEILLLKAPDGGPRDLIRWTKTVLKHEALAVRRSRERLLGKAAGAPAAADLTELVPADQDGPAERVASREDLERSREALRGLKRAELRALALLAAGCSYAEIAQITGFSRTKVNRCLAEGRERYRRRFAHSEDGTRCAEMLPLLSAFCDGEASPGTAAEVREHLRACAGCRAALRAYRAAPAAAALVPALPLSRSLLERGQELLAGLGARLPGFGGGAEASASQVAVAGGARGAGAAGLAKLLAVCAGTVGGAAACVATGVVPAPIELAPERQAEPRIERVAEPISPPPAPPAEDPAPVAAPPEEPEPATEKERDEPPDEGGGEPPQSAAGAVEYPTSPPPAPPDAAPSEAPQSAPGPGNAAGEFGP